MNRNDSAYIDHLEKELKAAQQQVDELLKAKHSVELELKCKVHEINGLICAIASLESLEGIKPIDYKGQPTPGQATPKQRAIDLACTLSENNRKLTAERDTLTKVVQSLQARIDTLEK